ncbi:uncharacterized protein [Littorina saxatilis]|uniref:Uncharacterized protein n=1 Tax=Littorina saxatilis TaxID=31220 RepID=A0AAN9AQA6_9CAEN
MMSTTAYCVLILACFAVTTHSFNLRMLDEFAQCPPFAPAKLQNCLNSLLDVTTDNCSSAKESMRCTRELVNMCMDNSDILNVLSSYDLSATFANVRLVCGKK